MKNTVKKVSSILIAIALLLSVASTITTNAFRGSNMPHDQEPWTEHGMTQEEFEAFLPTGVTVESSAGMQFSEERGMYYFPLLGLYYDPVSDMLFEPNHELWLNPEEHSIVSIHDMDTIGTIVDEQWLEFDIMHSNYQTIMPASLPNVGIRILGITSNSVTVEGTVTNVGSAIITARGFWIRDSDSEADFEQRLTSMQTNTFSMTIEHLRSSHMYHIRAIVRVEGVQGARQSDARTIMTLPQPGGTTPTQTPPPGNTPTPTPGGGTTPTPTPGGGTTPTPTPGGGTTPTPTPTTPTPTPGPNLSFSPSGSAPWNLSTWTASAAQSGTAATVNSYRNWSWSQGSGSEDWLTVSGSGVPGSQMTISVRPNDSGVHRTTTIVVTAGSLSRNLVIVQTPVLATMRGTRVIECYGRSGYIDINGSATSTTIECVSRSSANRPIWNFVHIADNFFAIRNDTTGRYFTENNGNLRHEARISGSGTVYDTSQRWLVIPQSNGVYRIRSVSNNTLYVQEGVNHVLNNPNVTLASRSTSHNRQLWRIGHIWHTDGSWVNFWGGVGTINIEVRALATTGAGDFYTAVDTARNIWENALGISFTTETNPNNANIRVYWGTLSEFGEAISRDWVRPTAYGVTIPPVILDDGISRGRVYEGIIQAGGITRNVYRLYGTGDQSMRVGIWSDSTRNINLATFTATHELGHALGYVGHSPNSNDLMRPTVWRWQTPDAILNPAELEHIRQIYRRFR